MKRWIMVFSTLLDDVVVARWHRKGVVVWNAILSLSLQSQGYLYLHPSPLLCQSLSSCHLSSFHVAFLQSSRLAYFICNSFSRFPLWTNGVQVEFIFISPCQLPMAFEWFAQIYLMALPLLLFFFPFNLSLSYSSTISSLVLFKFPCPFFFQLIPLSVVFASVLYSVRHFRSVMKFSNKRRKREKCGQTRIKLEILWR